MTKLMIEIDPQEIAEASKLYAEEVPGTAPWTAAQVEQYVNANREGLLADLKDGVIYRLLDRMN